MEKVVARVILLLFLSTRLSAQEGPLADSLAVLELNRSIDQNVVRQRMAELKDQYADDFVFTHGTGLVDGKNSWLQSVAGTHYLERTHDSVRLELHPGMVIARGQLRVKKETREGTEGYHLWYTRVFGWRQGRWQLVSHYTNYEQHD